MPSSSVPPSSTPWALTVATWIRSAGWSGRFAAPPRTESAVPRVPIGWPRPSAHEHAGREPEDEAADVGQVRDPAGFLRHRDLAKPVDELEHCPHPDRDESRHGERD